jgi:putative FmdB family regulatory protein
MPTYEYACKACGQHFDIKQSFTDAPLKVHESCGGELRKVFQPAPIVFKGSGWYVTDSRSKPPGEDGSASPATNGSAAPKGEGKSDSTSETKSEAPKSETPKSESKSSDSSSSSSSSSKSEKVA